MPQPVAVDRAAFDTFRKTLDTLGGKIDALAARLGAVVPAGKPPVNVAEAVERVLRVKVLPTDALALEVSAPAAALLDTLASLRAAGKVCNVGTDPRPVWTWILGDAGDTAELSTKIEHLISLRPMLMTEIVAATGARRNRISGALNKIQLRRKVENHGSASVALWFMPPARGKRR